MLDALQNIFPGRCSIGLAVIIFISVVLTRLVQAGVEFRQRLFYDRRYLFVARLAKDRLKDP
ncbi:MAG: hypothetical protein OXG78_13110 [Chloroflexi bacterium]|nr:hypothetical protein [Chloroflexota bacterium]